MITLNIGKLNFGKKSRGKKSIQFEGIVSDHFTRRDCASRVGEIFDLIGRFTPLTAELKLDLHDLCVRKLDWDDHVPIDLVPKWKNNFELISKLGEFEFRRCILPEDAVSLEMDTIEMGDSSMKLACSAVYARFKRKCGQYSCQLIFGRSKIIPENMTIPRGELLAAVLTATTGHVVNTALKKYSSSRLCLTDSQVALFWITNDKIPQKEWVRNRHIEISRLTPGPENIWRHIDTKHMTADIGTRRGATMSDVSETSPWVSGHEWARKDRSTFPIKSAAEIKLTNTDLKNVNAETLKMDLTDTGWINQQLSQAFYVGQSQIYAGEGVVDRIGERYRFSDYILDPNKFRFRKVVRILALVYCFI